MLYSEMGSMDEKEPRMNKIYADMYEGTWDTESGNVGVDLKNRIFRMQGSTYFNIVKMWDGNDNYFISTYLDNSIIEKTSQRNVNMLDEQNKEGMVYGDGYRFFIDEHQICHFNTQEKDQDIIFSSLEHIFNYNGE